MAFGDVSVNVEAVVSVAGALLAIVAWLFRMESGVKAAREKSADIQKDLEKTDLRIEKLETRHDAVNNEVRAMLLGIQSSISNIEGRLYISKRDRERNNE